MVAGMVLGAVSAMLSMLLFPVQIVVGLGFLALTILLMVKAYNNEEYALPTLGDLAKNWASVVVRRRLLHEDAAVALEPDEIRPFPPGEHHLVDLAIVDDLRA